MKEGVSIIICCFNSALLIKKTLEFIAAQKYEGIRCEVILVDNASSDHTAVTAAQAWASAGNKEIYFRIVTEQMPGLSYARRKGIAESNFEYLIFCDDDNLLDGNYVQNCWDLFQSNPHVAILGGWGTAEFEDPKAKPLWFDKFYHSYALGGQAQEESLVNVVYGAGMTARKSVLATVMAGQDMFLHGRKGGQLSAGEDSEICYRVRLAGHHILYSPSLTFSHFLPKGRLNWPYLKKLSAGFAKTFVVLNLYEKVLNEGNERLSLFYWMKKAFYYWGIYIKYWPKHYSAYKKGEGTIEEIHNLTWKNIALSYFEYNFETVTIYKKIAELKENISRTGQDAI